MTVSTLHFGRFLAATLLLFTVSFSALAVESELAELVEQGEYEQAYALALEHRFELEGESQFDFYYGMAAIETGNLSEGVFALERVLMERPRFHRARLELARGYFLMEEYTRADYHFERVRASEPPPTVVASIDRYQQAIQNRTAEPGFSISGFVGAGISYDTNVNSGPGSSTLTIDDGPFAGGTFDLGDGQAQEDGVLSTEARVRVQRPLTDGPTLYAQGDLNTTHHLDNNQLNSLRYGVRLGSRWTLNGLAPDVSLNAQQLWLDGDLFQNQLGVAANINHLLSPTRLLFYGANYTWLDHEDRPNSDADVVQGSLGWVESWRGSYAPQTTLSTAIGRVIAREDTTGAQANTDRWQGSVNARARWQLPFDDWTVSQQAQYRYSQYSGNNPIFDETREDHFGLLSVSADWTPLNDVVVIPTVEARFNRSNIDLYTYDRLRAEVRARYRF